MQLGEEIDHPCVECKMQKMKTEILANNGKQGLVTCPYRFSDNLGRPRPGKGSEKAPSLVLFDNRTGANAGLVGEEL